MSMCFSMQYFQNRRLSKWRRWITGRDSPCVSTLSLATKSCRSLSPSLRRRSTCSSGASTATRSSTSSTSSARYVGAKNGDNDITDYGLLFFWFTVNNYNNFSGILLFLKLPYRGNFHLLHNFVHVRRLPPLDKPDIFCIYIFLYIFFLNLNQAIVPYQLSWTLTFRVSTSRQTSSIA